MTNTAIWWVRRDLRLTDNQALAGAMSHAESVVPVFVLDPILLAAADLSEKRLAFLFAGLRALDADLRTRGSRLIIRRGEPLAELTRLTAECAAEHIFAEADPWPYGQQRDQQVGRSLPLRLVEGLTFHAPGSVVKADGRPYTVFTPFSRAWSRLAGSLGQAILPAPQRMAADGDLPSLDIPEAPQLPASVPFIAGEAEALRRLSIFVSGDNPPIYSYQDGRNLLDQDGTSQLSPYLRFGMLSARQAVSAAHDAQALAPDAQSARSAETWLSELVWREFYMHILHHFPEVLERSFRRDLQRLAWDNQQGAYDAWREGQTGFPVVDAAMQQLAHTGWMHNRARMIVGSFLTKDLLVDWRWGERHFMHHLVDGDPAANNGGWQWVAGTGTDAAPYFRVFNPVLQGKKCDPHGRYIRRWLPELASVPDRYVHEPWRMPADGQRQSGCVIGKDYPFPLVDHAWARQRALAAYRQAREIT